MYVQINKPTSLRALELVWKAVAQLSRKVKNELAIAAEKSRRREIPTESTAF